VRFNSWLSAAAAAGALAGKIGKSGKAERQQQRTAAFMNVACRQARVLFNKMARKTEILMALLQHELKV